LIIEIAALAEQLKGPGREHTTIKEIAESLRRPSSEIIRGFTVLGIVPRSWDDPERYEVEDLLETTTRHEVAARYNRVE
jgi:hypothetical protein